MSEQEVEATAKKMGWQPKEDYKGDPERWIPAGEYVERGETLLPIVRAENAKLRNEMGTVQGELQQFKTLLKQSQETIDALVQSNTEQNLIRAREKKKELAIALGQARQSGDTEKELEIQDQITDTSAAIRKAEAAPVKTGDPAATSTKQELTPDMKSFITDNPWFGSTDKRRTALTMAEADMLRQEGNTDQGRKFYDQALARADAILDAAAGRGSASRTQKVEGGGGGSGDTGNVGDRGKSFADLPADAQQACNRTASRVVGKDRKFKDIKSWQAHYTREYFAS